MLLAFRCLALGGLVAAAAYAFAAQDSTPVPLIEADRLYNAGDCNAAISAYRAILTRHPDDGTSALQMGDCYEKLAQVEKQLLPTRVQQTIQSSRGKLATPSRG
jgi:hypothetical protein